MPLRKIRYIKQLYKTSAIYKVISTFPSDKLRGNSEDIYVPVAINFKIDINYLHVSYNNNDNNFFRKKNFQLIGRNWNMGEQTYEQTR